MTVMLPLVAREATTYTERKDKYLETVKVNDRILKLVTNLCSLASSILKALPNDILAAERTRLYDSIVSGIKKFTKISRDGTKTLDAFRGMKAPKEGVNTQVTIANWIAAPSFFIADGSNLLMQCAEKCAEEGAFVIPEETKETVGLVGLGLSLLGLSAAIYGIGHEIKALSKQYSDKVAEYKRKFTSELPLNRDAKLAKAKLEYDISKALEAKSDNWLKLAEKVCDIASCILGVGVVAAFVVPVVLVPTVAGLGAVASVLSLVQIWKSSNGKLIEPKLEDFADDADDAQVQRSGSAEAEAVEASTVSSGASSVPADSASTTNTSGGAGEVLATGTCGDPQ